MKVFDGIRSVANGFETTSAGAAHPIRQGSTVRVRKGESIQLTLPINPQYGDLTWRAHELSSLKAKIVGGVGHDRARDRAFRMHTASGQIVQIQTRGAAAGDHKVVLERLHSMGVTERLRFTVRVA